MRNSRIYVQKGSLYVGIDESNHGLFPEIYVGIFSKIRKDVQESKRILPKERRDFSEIQKKVRIRDYSFLLIESERVYERIGHNKMPGVVASSLLDRIETNFDTLNIIFDGTIIRKWEEYAKDQVAEILSISSKRINFYSGGKFDQKYPIVNMADGMARYLHRKPLSSLGKNRRRKPLLAA